MPRHRREVSMIEWVLRVTLLISYSYQREGLDKIIDWICSFTKHVGRRQKIEWWFGFGLFGDWTNQILSQPTTYTYRATTLFLLDVANVLSKNNNKNHLSFNTKDLIGTSTSFVRVFLHLQWFLKGGGIDFFPPILIFPLFLFLVFLSLNSFFFFFTKHHLSSSTLAFGPLLTVMLLSVHFLLPLVGWFLDLWRFTDLVFSRPDL